MLTPLVLELTLPMNSSMIFGLFPAAFTMDGDGMSVGIKIKTFPQNRTLFTKGVLQEPSL